MGQFVDKVDIAKVLEGIGVHKIITVNPLNLAASVAAVQECDKLPGVKAIIFKSPCIAISGQTANAGYRSSVSTVRNVFEKSAVRHLLP